MKRFTLLLSMFLFLAATSVTFVSCDKDDDENKCEQLAKDMADAATAYNANMTDATLCNAYSDAINAYVNGCGDLSDEDKAGFLLIDAFLMCDDL